MTDEPQTDALPRRRRAFNSVLGAALLAAGVFAALQAHTFWTARRGGNDGVELPGRKSPRGNVAPPADAPGAWGNEPANVLSDARLAPLDGDPAGIAPPAEQDLRARILYDRRGRQPWPVCGRFLP